VQIPLGPGKPVNRQTDWMRDLRLDGPSGPVIKYRLAEEELERYRRLPPPPGSVYIDPAAKGAKVAIARLVRSSRLRKERGSEQVQEEPKAPDKEARNKFARKKGEKKVTREQLEALIEEGLGREEICRRLDIGKSTFWRYVADWGLKDKMAKAPAPTETAPAAGPEKPVEWHVVPGPQPMTAATAEAIAAMVEQVEKHYGSAEKDRGLHTVEVSGIIRLNGRYSPSQAALLLEKAIGKLLAYADPEAEVIVNLHVSLSRLRE